MHENVWWIIGLIVLFLLGSIFGLRISPREKALGQLRERTRKIGLQPRLIPAPEWTQIPKVSDSRATMVAYYSLIIPNAQLNLLRAINRNGYWQVVSGASEIDHQRIELQGVYALDRQANSIGVYWDEHADLAGTQLEKLKQYLHSLAHNN